MFRISRRLAAVAALLAGSACADRPTPAEPGDAGLSPVTAASASQAATDQRSRHERLARAFAMALHDKDFRAEVYSALQQSQYREGKVHLQQFLGLQGAKHRRRMAELAEAAEADLASDLDTSAPIEIYLPVPGHRSEWRGDARLLVATAEADADAPVAFDTKGKRQVLDPAQPPATPVIALERAEVDFSQPGPALATCPECGGSGGSGPGGGAGGSGSGGSGGGSGNAVGVTPGLYMTYATFSSTFEGWLKGAPEFETHILGQDGSSNAMKSYQCAGESAGLPYRYNQDSKTWSGSVLLFSQTQLDAYKAEHPGQALRVFVVEDDDTPCVIKTDSARVARLFQQLVNNYGALTGGIDTVISMRTYRRASTVISLLKSLWSLLASKDEVVGNAVEDVVAREYYPGANWVVKGDNSVTNGAIRLEMR